MVQTLWKIGWQFQKRLNTELQDLATSLLREMKIYIHRKTYTQILIAALFITAPKWELKWYSGDGWINKMWYICTEHSIFYEKDKVLTHVMAAWTLKTLYWVKEVVTQPTHCVAPLTWSVQDRQTHRHRKQICGSQGLGGGGGGKWGVLVGVFYFGVMMIA